MKKTVLYALFPLVFGCQYIEKAPSKDELLDKEMKSVNWNEVDEYPSIADCEALKDKTERRHCFFEFLTEEIQQKLGIDTLAILYPKLDTIQVKVTVFPDSTIGFEPNFTKDSTIYDTKRIDSILHARLVDFPKVSPAIKRGIPVKSQFLLPILLKTE
ncbi:MAG: hypothetical protein EOO48_06475 [Flavobacterium sp.]|nr:MAG: hypothetical protein EOO48_06475 [Flavobacterium sp.]